MILVDSSVWVDHLRQGNPRLVELLERMEVLTHPCVIVELALGSLRNRRSIVETLRELPQAEVARDDEILDLIERRTLSSRGIGYVDAHLIASSLLTPGAALWTRDRRLAEAANDLGVSLH